MKKIILLLILLISFNGYCQNIQEERQTRYFKEAIYSLNNGSPELSFRLFRMAYRINSDNKIGKKSLKKYDSIKTVLRNYLKSEIKGEWILIEKNWNEVKKYNSDSIQYFVDITDNKIEFYEKRINQNIKRNIRTETLFFNQLQIDDSMFNDIMYSNNRVWNYSINYENGNLVTGLFGEIKKNENLIEWKNVGNEKLVYKRVD